MKENYERWQCDADCGVWRLGTRSGAISEQWTDTAKGQFCPDHQPECRHEYDYWKHLPAGLTSRRSPACLLCGEKP